MTGFLDGQVHESGGYVIDRSLRFSAASSQYLTRTPSVASDRRTLTFSTWVKRGQLSTTQDILIAGSNVAGQLSTQISFLSNDKLWVYSAIAGGATAIRLETTQLFRDVGAWYHIVVQFDTTNATASDRVKLYVNGVRVTSFSTATYPAQNYDTAYNNTVVHTLGRFSVVSANHFDGHFAETILAESALTPSSFGETNIETGEWVAKPYTGTYGTNGFYLDFADGTSTTTLGYDAAGSNDWTLTNFTRSAGVDDCWMKDVPAGNGEASAVQPSGNYAVWNSLDKITTATLAGANLQSTSAAAQALIGSIGMAGGLYYWELSFSAATAVQRIGLYGTTTHTVDITPTTNTIGVRFNRDTGALDYTTDGTNYTSIATGLTTGTYFPYAASTTNAKVIYGNFGQRSFAYTPPTGFKALCTSNLPTLAIKRGDDHFTAKTRTGTGASFSVSAIRHAVDWLFGKSRSAATDWFSYDVNRGVQKQLEFNTASAETTETTGLTAFNSDGYSGGALAQMNTNAATYIDYLFKAGGAPVSNTAGSITSQVSANPTAGFSIVTWTGTGANGTVGHGLGKAPKLIITFERNNGGSDHVVYHESIGNTKGIYLNLTLVPDTASTFWNNTTPASTVFSLGSHPSVNQSGSEMVAYCFAEIEGFSKFGSYTGNGNADGPFVFTGFKPRFVLVKVTSVAGTWWIIDTARSVSNVANVYVRANGADAENTGTFADMDILSNGFKPRGTNGETNGSGQTYIYWAIAECPINYSNSR